MIKSFQLGLYSIFLGRHMDASEWIILYTKEIEHAELARKSGNEGKARVCARRAAGIIIGEYIRRQGYTTLTNSAYDRLRLFVNHPDVSDQIKIISSHFLNRVNPDYKLPIDADLIVEARWLAHELLGLTYVD